MYETWYDYGQAKKEYFTNLIDQYGPYRFFLTLTFQYLLTDDRGLELADKYWRRTTKKIFEAKTRDPVTSITGCCIMEKSCITRKYNLEKNCHFHFLIKNHAIFSCENDSAITQLQIASWKVLRNFKNNNGTALVSAGNKGMHVQPIYNSDVNAYLCKEAWSFNWKRENKLFYLDKKGLVAASPAADYEIF